MSLVREGVLPRLAAAQVGADTSTVYAWLRADCPEAIGRPLRCFRCSPEVPADRAAYGYLLGLYLGDGWLGATRGRSWSLSVACDDAYPVLAAACADAMLAVLATSVCRVRRRGCHEVKSWSSHWPCLLPQHGPGKKHDRPIVLESWQRQVVEQHPGRFLRGLFHSDGWRGQNVAVRRSGSTVVRYYYSRYEFTNHSADIRLLCTQALDLLDVAWRPNGPYRISVARRAAVAVLDEHVGPKS